MLAVEHAKTRAAWLALVAVAMTSTALIDRIAIQVEARLGEVCHALWSIGPAIRSSGRSLFVATTMLRPASRIVALLVGCYAGREHRTE